MNRLEEGKNVFNIEIEALKKTKDALGDEFLSIIDKVVECKGKIIVTGMGKPGHIAGKIAATLSSLGSPAFHLHPAEAMHGDLGMIAPEDVVIAISYSGESDEILRILPNIKMIGALLIGITRNPNSTLAQVSDIVQILPKFDEACHLGLAPTSSTTVELCYGDAIAVVASNVYNFKDSNYAMFHPAGTLGKKLILRVEDLMAKEENNSSIQLNATLKDAIIELSKKGLGIVSIVDSSNVLFGVITDGDLRRQMEKGADIYAMHVTDVMSRQPLTIEKNALAVDALTLMSQKNISCLPVVDDNNVLLGTIKLQSIIAAGIII